MARKPISEFKAKNLLYPALGEQYNGKQFNDTHPRPEKNEISAGKEYVIKVDQGIKGRFKKGLVLLNKNASEIDNALSVFRKNGYSQFLVEEYLKHKSDEERYLSIERIRDGYKILSSANGGINIENNAGSIKETVIPRGAEIPHLDHLPLRLLKPLLTAFDKYYFSFLEINPLIIKNNQYFLLDVAAEADSSAAFFVNNCWSTGDFAQSPKRKISKEEINIRNLAAMSQAAFSFDLLNPDGSIFMLLSGGGASIVLADEVVNQGFGNILANYGEYSGNPNSEETYLYSTNVISAMLNSKAQKKVLIIAGGVANFTDIRQTFKGIIKALSANKKALEQQGIKVYVRRGGPHQEEGLSEMNSFLKANRLLGKVAGPEMLLTDIVTEALKEVI